MLLGTGAAYKQVVAKLAELGQSVDEAREDEKRWQSWLIDDEGDVARKLN